MHQRRFLFVDFDGLVASVREHLRLQSAVFGTDYPTHSSPLDASKVTKLLSGQDAAVSCQRGSHRRLDANDERLLSAAGWDLSKGPILEDLLKRNLSDLGACQGKQTRTLVLGLGSLTHSVLKTLDAYFSANWRVQIFCLRRSNMDVVDRLRVAHPTRFQNTYLDRLMKTLLRAEAAAPTVPSNQEDAQQRPQTTHLENANDRVVLMDLDNISETLFESTSLLQKARQASSSQDLRIDFRRLTRRTCGSTPSKVQRQVATYYNAHPLFVQGLMSLQWATKKQSKSNVLKFQLKFLAQLMASDMTNNPKTLVLVMGDAALDDTGKASYKGIIEILIAQQWHIEVHAWLDSLSTIFLGLEKEYPASVAVKALDDVFHELVFLKHTRSPAPPRRSDDLLPTSVLRAGNENNFATPSAQPRVGAELSRLHLQMQELGRAVAELRASTTLQTTNQVVEIEQRLLHQQKEFTRQLHQQKEAFSTQSEQLIQQARDARHFHRLVLQEREEMLTCPITHCLYESPVITACCGKTFSKAAVDRLEARNMSCPWCRQAQGFTTQPNRDVANLVEQYRKELNALGSAD